MLGVWWDSGELGGDKSLKVLDWDALGYIERYDFIRTDEGDSNAPVGSRFVSRSKVNSLKGVKSSKISGVVFLLVFGG
jgi:hypothetical protein